MQTTRDKVGSQNENSREHVLRFPKILLSENKDVFFNIQLLSVLGSGNLLEIV